MIKIILLSFILLFTSCATTQGYKNICKSYLNSSESSLIMNWGAPSYIAQTNEGKIITYVRQTSYITPTTTNINTYYDGEINTRAITTGGNIIRYVCETTFLINDYGTVIGYSFRGNNCIAI